MRALLGLAVLGMVLTGALAALSAGCAPVYESAEAQPIPKPCKHNCTLTGTTTVTTVNGTTGNFTDVNADGAVDAGQVLISSATRPRLTIIDPTVTSRGRFGTNHDGVFFLTNNANYDGTNWNRDDTTETAWMHLLRNDAANDKFEWNYVASGANPITWTQIMALSSAGLLSPLALSTAGTITGTSTGATMNIKSDTSAATSSSTVGAFTFAPTAVQDSGDLHTEWNNSAGTSLAYILDEGSAWFRGNFTINNGTLFTGLDTPFDLRSNATATTATASVAAFRVRTAQTLGANDLAASVCSPDAVTNWWAVDIEGDTFQTGDLASTQTTSFDITSATSAATATTDVAAFTIAPTVALDADDQVVEVNNSAGTRLMALDQEGDLRVARLYVGTAAGGGPIADTMRGSELFDFGNLVTACAVSTGHTVTGAALGDTCTVGFGTAPEAGAAFTCEVYAADTVRIKACGLGTVDPASRTYYTLVFGI